MKATKSAILILFLIVSGAIVTGCGSAQTVEGLKPEDKLNPQMTAQQKAVMLKPKSQHGD